MYYQPLSHPIGTKLRVLSAWHHEGTFVGPDCVIHADKEAGVVHATSFADFAGDDPVQVIYEPRSWAEAQEIVRCAWETTGIPYNLFGVNGLNCEQAANYHQRREAISPTLRLLGTVATVIAVALLTSGK